MSSAQSAQIVAIVAVMALAMAGVLFCRLMEEVSPPQSPPEPPPPPGIRSRKSKPATGPQPPRRERKPLGPYANRPDPKMEELIMLLHGDRATARRLAESAGGADIAITKLLRDRM